MAKYNALTKDQLAGVMSYLNQGGVNSIYGAGGSNGDWSYVDGSLLGLGKQGQNLYAVNTKTGQIEDAFTMDPSQVTWSDPASGQTQGILNNPMYAQLGITGLDQVGGLQGKKYFSASELAKMTPEQRALFSDPRQAAGWFNEWDTTGLDLATMAFMAGAGGMVGAAGGGAVGGEGALGGGELIGGSGGDLLGGEFAWGGVDLSGLGGVEGIGGVGTGAGGTGGGLFGPGGLFSGGGLSIPGLGEIPWSLVGAGAGGLLGGAGGNEVAGYTTQTQEIPDWLKDYVTDVLDGGYLDPEKNKYLESIATNMTGDINASVGSLFSKAGRYGSGAHQDVLADSVGATLAKLYGGAYDAERNRMTSVLTGTKVGTTTSPYFDNKISGILGGVLTGGAIGNLLGGRR